MAIGLLGKKCGMTRIFNEDGSASAVTVVKVSPNVVVSLRDKETDGYESVQVTTGEVKRSRMNKPTIGHYAKAGVDAGRILREFRYDSTVEKFDIGQEIGVNRFKEGEYVDVQGVSIGKGFQGVIKRYNFRTQDATHGNSLSHRAPGSIGQNQTPGRVFKGKKMSGHMGARKTTVQNLIVCKIDTEKSLLLISGAIPGAIGGDVVINKAVKR